MRLMTRGRTPRERGVTLVLVTGAFSAFMVIAAFAVDLGNVYAERRHDQNAVDAAVMSGAVESTIGGGGYPEVIAEIRAKAEQTLGRTITDEAWLACSDGEQLHYTARDLAAIRSDIPLATDCISWSLNFLELRVRIPSHEVPGIFGPVFGAEDKVVSAAANASINEPGVGATPFVALSTALAGDFVCLRTGPGSDPLPLMDGNGPGAAPTAGTRPDPCDSSAFPTSSENFGTLSPHRYLDGCTQQKADIEVAISIGIDHNMKAYPEPGYDPSLPESLDGDENCTELNPNTFYTDTGFNAQGLRCALLSNKTDPECNGVSPRLHQGEWVQDDILFASEHMDNIAPWEFLLPAADLFDAGAPENCVAVAASRPDTRPVDDPRSADDFDLANDGGYDAYSGVADSDWDHYDRFDTFTACLAEWGTGFTGELFTEDIVESSRFAFIPQVHEANFGVDKVHIEGFVPTFMYRLYQSTSGNNNDPCDDDLDSRESVPFYMHDAGQTFGHNGVGPSISCGEENQNVDRLASIVMACGMMPDVLCDKEQEDQESPIVGNDFYEIRLSK